MSRITSAPERKKRKRRLFKQVKGYRLGKKNLYRHAIEQVERSMAYSYRDRKVKKRDYRSLWIIRINAAARINGLSYSRLMSGLKKADVQINRKILADLAVNDEKAFAEISEIAKKGLGAGTKAAN